MATARSQEAICRIVRDRILELETEAGREPKYNGVVLTEDKLLVIDRNASNLQVHSRHDGKLYTSHRLESDPSDVCLISKTKVAVCLEYISKIVILSFKSVDVVKLVKTLDVGRGFDVKTGFYRCYSVAKWNSDKLVVSGWKDGMLCWGVVSITDGDLHSTHDICIGYNTHLAIQDNTVYISCQTHDSITRGVYAYDICNPHTHKFLYQHMELKPGRIMADRDCVYVIDRYSNRIHQLTDSGQVVTIHRVSGLYGIFYDDQHGVLYTTRSGSNLITVYKMEYSHKSGVPIEILKMDDRSIQLFKDALKDGKETVHSIRIMVVGHMGVGKTTLVKRLLGEEVNISERRSTEGIDVYVNCCDVSLSTHAWKRRTKDSGQDYRLQRIAKVLNEQQSVKGKVTDKQVVILPEGDRTERLEVSHVDAEDQDAEVLYNLSSVQDIDQYLSSTTSQQEESPAHQKEESPSPLVQRNATQSETNTIAMLKLLKENVNELEGTVENSLLTIWDFAGQYAFYTTHQTFLTRRAIYLLVSDVSGHVTDLVADECYFDSDGIMKCKVHELIEVWLNSIHSCASSPEAGSPPVILVGTHVDKISQKLSPAKGKVSETQIATSEAVEFTLTTTSTPADTSTSEQPRASTIFGAVKKFVQPRKTEGLLEVTPVTSMAGAHASPGEDHLKKHKKWSWLPGRKQKKVKTAVMSAPSTDEPVGETIMGVDAEKGQNHEICKRYFTQIRSYLKDKPTRFHLIDEDFAIDNTVVDSKLEELKRKIVEVASQQPYWGEEIPARWLPLEQELMRLKATGLKVISREEVEKINKEGTVQIENSEELDLFLRFLHETGTVIYFSIEVLRENIVLDPSWLIDALKSLINAQPDRPESPADNDTQSRSPHDSVVTQKWSDFKGKGILSSELVDAVWTEEKYPELHANKDHMLLIMEQLNIIAKPRAFSEIGEKVENYFLTPCMLRQESPREVISLEQDSQIESTPVLCFVFRGKFLPPPIFHRLLAACVARWPVAKKKGTSEHLIFCGCCIFDIDLFHRLYLHFRNHIVYARITRMVIDEVKTLDAKLCTRVRKFLTLNLSKITSYLGQNLQYELRTQYPPSQSDSKYDMIGLSPPFDMWYADEGQDSDSSITHEHMNYARLCIALVTVCGNAMREILLTNVPNKYSNIYDAILDSEPDLINRRRGRPALLNQEQINVVFPDPLSRYVGTVDQFDISVLYVLVRSVSSVATPASGWGVDPPDQPRDRSLGASVERIRSYRNLINGHSKDGKIDQQEFEDYWNKIRSVIRDIEAVIGGHSYSQELDQQRRRVITIYEAC